MRFTCNNEPFQLWEAFQTVSLEVFVVGVAIATIGFGLTLVARWLLGDLDK